MSRGLLWWMRSICINDSRRSPARSSPEPDEDVSEGPQTSSSRHTRRYSCSACRRPSVRKDLLSTGCHRDSRSTRKSSLSSVRHTSLRQDAQGVSADVRAAIEGAQKPIVFVEGKTGVRYVRKAAELLGRSGLLERIELQDGRGVADLGKFWKSCTSIPSGVVPHDVILLADCDSTTPDGERGNLILWRRIPERDDTPVRKGIENLFRKDTLKRAVDQKPAFIDIIDEHAKKVRGKRRTVAERWTVNGDEKTNLCRWLCENGTAEDFDGFRVIFDLLEQALEPSPVRTEGS